MQAKCLNYSENNERMPNRSGTQSVCSCRLTRYFVHSPEQNIWNIYQQITLCQKLCPISIYQKMNRTDHDTDAYQHFHFFYAIFFIKKHENPCLQAFGTHQKNCHNNQRREVISI